jgi:hypothetical protein
LKTEPEPGRGKNQKLRESVHPSQFIFAIANWQSAIGNRQLAVLCLAAHPRGNFEPFRPGENYDLQQVQ